MVRRDGFGAQFQGIIYTIIFAYFNDYEYVNRPIEFVDHNYDNNYNFMETIHNCMNIQDNYLNISQVNSFIEIPREYIYNVVDTNIDRYMSYNPAINKIKYCFWKNKNKNVYKNDIFNVAVHIRRPNCCDDGSERGDTEDIYYINTINHIREKYKSKKILFHIYSQGDINNFDCYKNDDVIFHINQEVTSTFIELVGANVLITSKSSFSYTAALLSDGEVYYLPFWHPPKKEWIIL
jgi:hypothetical protein